MKYVLVHNIPSPYRLPLYREMRRQLAERGVDFEVHFMAKGHKERPKSWLNPHIDAPHRYWRDWGFGQHHFNPGLVFSMIRNPPEWLDLGSPYDTFTCILLALFCKSPNKVMVLEGNTKTPGRVHGFVGWFKRLIMSKAKYLPVPGHDAKKFIDIHRLLTNKKLGPAPFRPNIIDAERFHPKDCWEQNDIEACRKEFGVSRDMRMCLIPARLVKVKGLIPFIELLNKEMISGWKIIIVGDGPLRSDIIAAISRRGLNDNIQMHSFVPYEKMPIIYASSDLVMLPSVYDPNPLTADRKSVV